MSPTVQPDVAAELRSYLPRRRVTQGEVAESLGVTTTWLARRLRSTVAMTVDDLVLICGALDVDPAKVLADALALAATA